MSRPEWSQQHEGPEVFVEAADTFLRTYPADGLLTRGRVAVALSNLAGAGYLVSAAHHNEVCGEYAEKLRQVEDAANELACRLQEGDR